MHTCTKKADYKRPHQYDLTQQDIRTHKSRDCTQLRSYPAQLFSVRDTLGTLPILLKLSHCSILSHIYKWVCIPTVKLTGDSCIATVPGRGRGRRENQSGSRDGPVWASVRDLEWLGELQRCVGKRPQSRKQECAAGGDWGFVPLPSVSQEGMLASVCQVTWWLCVPAPHLTAQFNWLARK